MPIAAENLPPFQVTPLADTFVAEITGIDLSQPLDQATFAAIRDAWHDHSILVFRDQELTEAQQIAFTRRFGALYGHLLSQFLHPDHPEILVVSNILENGKPIGLLDAGRLWHADLSYLPAPSAGAMLYAREVPEEGGDTLFADTIAAYDALPDDTKARIKGKRVLHRFIESYEKLNKLNPLRPKLTDEQRGKLEDVVHPAAFVHPGNGRTGLYVSEGFASRILGIPEAESRALLGELNAHATQDRFVYRHKWRAGDLVFWDNRSTIHKATGGYALPQRRLMHRTTLKAEDLVGA